MNSKSGVIVGLVIALVVLTVPFWYALGQQFMGKSVSKPSVPKPTNAEKCIEENMRARHMQVIDEWRNAVVREGVTDPYRASDGNEYERSLTKTCLMQCHSTEEEPKTDEAGTVLPVQERFCQECHEYTNIRPNCWDCHLKGSP